DGVRTSHGTESLEHYGYTAEDMQRHSVEFESQSMEKSESHAMAMRDAGFSDVQIVQFSGGSSELAMQGDMAQGTSATTKDTSMYFDSEGGSAVTTSDGSAVTTEHGCRLVSGES